MLTLTGLLITACSSTTTVKESWVEPGNTDKIEKVYIIGITSNEAIRMHFEQAFSQELSDQDVRSVISYNGLPEDLEASKKRIIQEIKTNGCDSVLLTKLIRKMKEQDTTGAETRQGVKYSVPIHQGYWYNGWGNYYGNGYSVTSLQPDRPDITTLVVESVLYDLKTEKMIWSAQLETVEELDTKKMIKDYVKEVTKDLKQKGLI